MDRKVYLGVKALFIEYKKELIQFNFFLNFNKLNFSKSFIILQNSLDS